MEEDKYYTSCEEIPLRKFIEMYKGDLKALIIEGNPGDKELREASTSIIEEYSMIVGGKNFSFEIDDRSRMINYGIKIALMDVIISSCEFGRIGDIKDLLIIFSIPTPNEGDIEGLNMVLRRAASIKAEAGLRLSAITRNEKAKDSKRKVDFTKERMILSSHFKMKVDMDNYTAAEYGNLIRLMLNDIKEMESYGK